MLQQINYMPHQKSDKTTWESPEYQRTLRGPPDRRKKGTSYGKKGADGKYKKLKRDHISKKPRHRMGIPPELVEMMGWQKGDNLSMGILWKHAGNSLVADGILTPEQGAELIAAANDMLEALAP